MVVSFSTHSSVPDAVLEIFSLDHHTYIPPSTSLLCNCNFALKTVVRAGMSPPSTT